MEASKTDPETQAYINALISSNRPDASKSFSATAVSFSNINSEFEKVLSSCIRLNHQCQSFISNGNLFLSPQEAASIAKPWIGSGGLLEMLDKGILAIAKCSDAVLVHGVGAPEPPRRVLPIQSQLPRPSSPSLYQRLIGGDGNRSSDQSVRTGRFW